MTTSIGAGTGGLTTFVAPALAQRPTQYVFTDLSHHFLLRAEEKFRDYPFLEYKRLDIEIDPCEQGYEAHAFDLVLASECLHATQDIRQSLANVRRLLAADGLFLLVEAARSQRWLDMTFGLTEDWWRFADHDLRPAYPLMSCAGWRAVLHESGFSDVQELTGLPEDTIENSLILARGPGVEMLTDITGEGQLAEQQPHDTPTAASRGWLILADRGGVGQRLAEQLRNRGDRVVTAHLADELQQLGDEEWTLNGGDRRHVERLLETLAGEREHQPRAIVHAWALDAATSQRVISTPQLEASQTAVSQSLLHLVQTLSEQETSPQLFVLTQRVQSPRSHLEPTSPVQAPAWGLGLVTMGEAPQLRTRLIDLGDADQQELDALIAELDSNDGEDEVALRGTARNKGRELCHA